MNENNDTSAEQGPEPSSPGASDHGSDSEPSTTPGAGQHSGPAPEAGPAQHSAGPAPHSNPAPQPEPFLVRLRRSKTNVMVGGVAGGLGDATGIDPLIFRVGFVIAGFLGGAGFILYAAAWMLVPEEGSDIGGIGKEFKVQNDPQVRTIGLIVGGIFALMAALGSGPWFFTSWTDWSSVSFWTILSVSIVAGLIYWIFVASKGQSMDSQHVTPPNQPAAGGYPASTNTWTDSSGTTATQPITKPAPEPGGFVLFGLTLSLGAMILGGLALWASTTEPLEPRVYLAVALGITAVGTFVGIRWGKPGPLLTTGVVLSIALVLSSLVPNVSMGSVQLTPDTMREIREPITLGMGEIELDLREISPASTLAGQTINVKNGMGQIEIIVPEGVDVEVNAAVRIGQILVFGRNRSGGGFGIGQTNEIHHEADGPNPLIINATTNIGEVLVTQR